MMNSMRRVAGGFVAKLLMVFLVITFGVWGVGDILRNSGPSYAARIGSDTVSIGDFERQKAIVARRAEAAGLKDLNPNTLTVGILRQMVQQKLITLSLRDLGLYVNDALLMKTVRTEPAFQTKEGKFSAAAFQHVLEAERISEGALLNQVRDDASTKFMLASLDMSDVTPPAPVRALVATSALETRDAWIVTIAPTAAPAALDEAALKEFYEKNKSVLYVQPESRTLEYVTLKPTQIDSLIDQSITEQMLADAAKMDPKASPAALKERLRLEARDRVLHGLQAGLDDALAGGASLTEALNKAGLTTPVRQLADINETAAKANPDEVLKTVAEQGFQMGEGETSGLIMSPHGTPVIVHVKTIRPAGTLEYNAVAADVRAKVAEQQRHENARQRVQQVKEALNILTGGSKRPTEQELQAVLKHFNLTARRVNALSRPENGAPTNGLPASLLQAIFEHPLGSIAGPLALPSGGQMLAVVIDAHHPESSTLLEKGARAADKSLVEISTILNQTVQSRAFAYFAERHRVTVNPQLLKTDPAGAQADDQAP